MIFKSNVSILQLSPQSFLAMSLSEQVFVKEGCEFFIASVYRNGAKELRHAQGHAFDIRVLDIPKESWRTLESKVNAVLKPLGFDVILENPNNEASSPVASHIHVEYDPKDASGKKLIPLP